MVRIVGEYCDYGHSDPGCVTGDGNNPQIIVDGGSSPGFSGMPIEKEVVTHST